MTHNNQVIKSTLEFVKYVGIELASAISFSSLVESVVKKKRSNSRLKFVVQISKLYGFKSKTYTLFCSYSMFI